MTQEQYRNILSNSYAFTLREYARAVEFAQANGMAVIMWDYPNYLVIPADAVELMSLDYDVAYMPE